MQNTRLIKLLKTLSAAEFRRFLGFVASPFFNQHTQLQSLAELLHQAYPDFGSASIEKGYLFKQLFSPEAEFQEQKIHDLFSQLTRLLEKYFAQVQYEKTPHAQQYYLLSALAERKEDSHFKRVYQRHLTRLSRHEQEDSKHFLHRFLIAELADYVAHNPLKRQNEAEHLSTVSYLDLFYLSTKLKYSCEAISRQNILNQAGKAELLQEIKEYLSQDPNPYIHIPAVNIYHCIYQMLTESQADESFDRLVQLLQIHAANFSDQELYALYAFAQNHCAKQINLGNVAYFTSLFELYQILLEKGLLTRTGYLEHQAYKNITTLGLRIKEYDWVKEFLENYRSRLHPEHRENAYTYNLANYFFVQDRYKEAMKYLQQVHANEWRYYLGAKSMLLQIYYELEDEEGISYLVQAVKVYLRRNKAISSAYIALHENFLFFLKKTFQLKQQIPRQKREKWLVRYEKLKQQMQEKKNIAYKGWVKNKLAELDLEKSSL